MEDSELNDIKHFSNFFYFYYSFHDTVTISDSIETNGRMFGE
jgi:hypothetical protein